jgi:hypothetical protein
MRVRPILIGLAMAALAATAIPAEATMLKQLNRADLSKNADRIFRGTVTGIDTSTVQAGGGTLPVVIYRFKVREALKGEFIRKGEQAYAEVRMIGTFKNEKQVGKVQHVSLFRDVPRLSMGGEYLMFATRSSAIGLSTSVGLGQGLFQIHGVAGKEMAVNSFNNAGLFYRMPSEGMGLGPIPYTKLAVKIRTLAR